MNICLFSPPTKENSFKDKSRSGSRDVLPSTPSLTAGPEGVDSVPPPAFITATQSSGGRADSAAVTWR